MSKLEKILYKVLQGTSDKNIPFKDLKSLMLALGFKERIKGSHHIYTKDGILEILNLQPKDSKSKPYQVKQVREVILKYKIGEFIK
jgi:predicted RNA binding protein YcfA (HicA-like mRNA interferase family)